MTVMNQPVLHHLTTRYDDYPLVGDRHRQGWIPDGVPLLLTSFPALGACRHKWTTRRFFATPGLVEQWARTEGLFDLWLPSLRDLAISVCAAWNAAGPAYTPPAAPTRRDRTWMSGCGHWIFTRDDAGYWALRPSGSLRIAAKDGILHKFRFKSLYTCNLYAAHRRHQTCSRNLRSDAHTVT